MDTYSQAELGDLLAWRGEHLVYRYGAAHVIKFSRFDWLLRGLVEGRIERDLALCREFFNDYVLESKTVTHGGRTLLFQPFVKGVPLRREHLADAAVRKQFNDIVQRHVAMVQAGHPPVDLLGQLGLFSCCLSNIFLLENGTLRMIDTMLMDPENLGFLTPLLRPLARWASRRQERVIRQLEQSNFQ